MILDLTVVVRRRNGFRLGAQAVPHDFRDKIFALLMSLFLFFIVPKQAATTEKWDQLYSERIDRMIVLCFVSGARLATLIVLVVCVFRK